MSLFRLLRPALFTLDAEVAHRLTIKALGYLPPKKSIAEDAVLSSRVAAVRFPSPVGLAAGFDKNAEIWILSIWIATGQKGNRREI